MQELKTDKRPLHIQAQQHLLRLIEQGTYKPGDQLPSESKLAAQLGISRPTLREALFNLEQDSVILRKHGVGTFVAPGYDKRLKTGLQRLDSILLMARKQGLSTRVLRLNADMTAADEEVAARLNLPPATPVTRVRRTIAVAGQSAAFLVDFVRESVLLPEELDASFDGSVLDLLMTSDSLQIKEAVAEITAIGADDLLAERLKVGPGAPILLLAETVFSEELLPVEYSRNYFLPEFFDFRVLRR